METMCIFLSVTLHSCPTPFMGVGISKVEMSPICYICDLLIKSVCLLPRFSDTQYVMATSMVSDALSCLCQELLATGLSQRAFVSSTKTGCCTSFPTGSELSKRLST